jgi:hypothetical protein
MVCMRSGYHLLSLIDQSEAVSVQRATYPSTCTKFGSTNLTEKLPLENSEPRRRRKPEKLQHVSTNSKLSGCMQEPDM